MSDDRASEARDGGTLDWTLDTSSGDSGSAAIEAEGRTIGRYRLLQTIGEGGFGTVWMAEQREPVKRRVALKVIKVGMDTKQVIARFEAERQALAMMDHPGIAKVFDAGSTATGRPYFVMEYIKGIPILEYCDAERLDAAARLELFILVCQAIQHAHQKGIIHRDIKPSNVLVTMHDGVPVPKVIDFGIAKATSGDLTERTLFTEHRQIIGTPAYMSPEQAEMSGLDIDTRSDVYSLGVLLYELLTGSTPFDHRELTSAGFIEMLRIIREVEPVRPSARIAALGDTGARAARQRRVEHVRSLGERFRGDLDWIVMKCLEKDRTRRYESASAVAADIRRHLADEPVSAGPPGVGYRLRKFVRRHRLQVAAGAVVGTAIVVGLVGTALALQRALRAESELRGQLTATEAAQAAERARADELALVAAFQSNMLAQVDPTAAGLRLSDDIRRRHADALDRAGLSETERRSASEAFRREWSRLNATDAALALIAETILRPAAAAIDAQFADQPVVAAQLRQSLADRHHALGLLESALPLQVAALETRRRVLGEDHSETIASINGMGLLLESLGRPADAEAAYREALERSTRVFGPEDRNTLAAMSNLGLALAAQGKLAEAETHSRRALEIRRRVLGDDDPETLVSINNVGSLLEARGRFEEAEGYWRESLEGSRRILGDDDPDTLISINNVGSLLLVLDRPAEAEPYYREALERSRRVLGEEHPDTLTSISNMAYLLAATGDAGSAERLFREALEKRRRVLGEDHPETIASISLLGNLLRREGRAAEAVALATPSEASARAAFGDGREPELARFLVILGRAHLDEGEPEQAEPRLLEAWSRFDAVKHSDGARECAAALVELYDLRAKAEPNADFGEKATRWRGVLERSRERTR